MLILQHARERFHAFNTARIVHRALQNSALVSGYPEQLSTPPAAKRARAALLYPGPDSRLIESLSPAERPEQLVVLDGTWHHAKTMLRDIPWLQTLPQVRLNPDQPSRYRIRRAPAHDALSTVEATVEILRALEPETTDLPSLLGAFDVMIERQLAVHPREPAPRHRQRGSAGPVRNPPAALRADANRLVVAYVESATLQQASGRTLLSCSAHRMGTGESFGALLRPANRIPLNVLRHLEVEADAFDRGLSAAGFCDRWHAFTHSGDTLIAYHPRTFELLSNVDANIGRTVALKSLDFGIRPRPASLEQLLQSLGLTTMSGHARDRAARRLADACALVEHVRTAYFDASDFAASAVDSTLIPTSASPPDALPSSPPSADPSAPSNSSAPPAPSAESRD